MVCKNCGSELFEEDRFCSKCGTRVTEPVSDTHSAPEEERGTEAEEMVITRFAPNAEAETEGAVTAGEGTKDAKTERAQAGAEGASDMGRILPPCIPEEKPSKAKGRLRFKNAVCAVLGVRKKTWISRAVLGILCILALVPAANGSKLSNYFHRYFSSPEEYYCWVERRSLKESARVISDYYINYFLEYLHRYDRSVSGELRVEFGEAAMEVMEEAGADISWPEEWAVSFESNNRDSVIQGVLGLETDGTRLLTMDGIIDFKDEAAYLGILELSKTYLAVDTEQKGFVEYFYDVFGMEPEEYSETLELLEILYNEYPDKKEIEALADKYLNMLFDNINDVKMRMGRTIRVGSISQTCTTLELYLDKNDIQNIMTEILEELQEDEDVEALLTELFDLAAETELDILKYRDGDEYYEAFQDNIAQILDELDYNITYHDELEMTVYVDNKGRIIGRTIEFPNSWNEIAFSYMNPRNGSKFGYKGSINVNSGEVSVIGSGKVFGGKISGSFTLKLDGSGIVDVEVKNLDMTSLKKGYINGKFTVTAASGMGRALGVYSASSILSDMQLILDISMRKSSEKLYMELKENAERWGSLTFTVKRDKGRKISVPSTKGSVFVEDQRDFEDWWDTVKWEDLIKKMNKAGFPSEVMDAVEEYSQMNGREILEELADDLRFLINGFGGWY